VARRLETEGEAPLLPAAGGGAAARRLQMGEAALQRQEEAAAVGVRPPSGEAALLPLAAAAAVGEHHLTAGVVQRAGEPLVEAAEVARQRRRVVVEGLLQLQSAAAPQVALDGAVVGPRRQRAVVAAFQVGGLAAVGHLQRQEAAGRLRARQGD